MSYNVDVALNGQQFTGRPVSFRYYDIEIEKVEPDFGPIEGGTNLIICGRGLYDAGIKRIQFETHGKEGVREVTADWDRKDRAIRCTVPPLAWMFQKEGESEEIKKEEPEDGNEIEENQGPTEEEKHHLEVAKNPIRIKITFNNQEWIDAKQFKYHESQIIRLAYGHQFSVADPA